MAKLLFPGCVNTPPQQTWDQANLGKASKLNSVWAHVDLVPGVAVDELLGDVVALLLARVLVRVGLPVAVGDVRVGGAGSGVGYPRSRHHT